VRQVSGVTGPLYGISFTDGNDGCAVGSSGILRTTNGGETWLLQLAAGSGTFRAVHFIGASVGTVVGDAGRIYRTITGGWYGWASQTSGCVGNLNGVSFFSQSLGVAVGDSGLVLRTIDGGMTWVRRPGGTTRALHGVSVAGDSFGVAVGDSGTIIRTKNAARWRICWVCIFTAQQ
jgi:photosystem II stability/assembly factor-like uncharacterized protein